MFAFGRACGDPLSSFHASPYDQVSDRLIKLGHAIRENESKRSHCIRLAEVIRVTALTHRKKSKPSAAAPVGKMPNQESVKAYIGKISTVDPKSNEFLNTFEWKAVRMMAIKKHGAVCQCCGASPKTGAVMHVDHIKPRKFFPELALDVENLQILCGDCNGGKGNWDQTDWR